MSIPKIVTVHDLSHLICPAFQDPLNNHTLRYGLQQATAAEAQFIAVSKATKEDLCDRLDVLPEQVHVVYEGSDQKRFAPQRDLASWQHVQAKYQIPAEPFLFSVSTLEPRKNLPALLAGYERFLEKYPDVRCHMVVAGRQGWGENVLGKYVQAHPQRIHPIGYVSDEDLPLVMGASVGVCYLSVYEGFGLPLVEAMGCEVPSLYANCSVLPEIAGNCGLAVDPTDPDTIAESIYLLTTSESVRHQLIQNAKQRISMFRWDKTASETLACYAQMLEWESEAAIYQFPTSGNTNKRSAA